MLRLNLLLIAALVVSAVSMVSSQHRARALHTDISILLGAPISRRIEFELTNFVSDEMLTGLLGLIDALMALPGILLALTVAATLGPGLYNAMIAVGVAWIPSFARIVRSSVLQIKETTYVEAARASGANELRLITRHILPNTLAAILVLASLGVATAILVGAALSFLGVGASPPTPEWGIMLSDGRPYMRSAWWIMAYPGLAITVTVLGANLVGDGLRDALDPRMGSH